MIKEIFYKKTEKSWERIEFVRIEVGDIIKKHHSNQLWRVIKPPHMKKTLFQTLRTINAKPFKV
jgi:hypothetical protein